MSDQQEQQAKMNADLEDDETEAEYEGDLGDAGRTKGGAGIIGLGSCI